MSWTMGVKMNDRPQPAQLSMSISAVERDTGLSKDTLRVWERRYGFPTPERDVFGERIYSMPQVEKLRVIRRLMDAGHRPGKIIGLPFDHLQALSSETAESRARVHGDTGPAPCEDLDSFMRMIVEHEVAELRNALSQSSMRLGLERFVTEIAAPLNERVGDAWARGDFQIFEEHLYTESMQIVLRNAISNIPQTGQAPRVLLTTFPHEAHGLGLLMAEALMAMAGCRCVSLGVQTPILEIVRAALSQRVDVVALSFSPSGNPNHVLDGLAELRGQLPRAVQIWSGGRNPVLMRRPPRDVLVMPELADITTHLHRWRSEHSVRA